MESGTIKTIIENRGFGFIAVPGRSDVYFHATDLAADLSFDRQLKERRVRFDTIETAKGPRAVSVRPTN